MLRERTMTFNVNKKSDAVAGDIVLYNTSLSNMIILKPHELNTYDYPSSKYYPIGIVVIPSSHNVYGTKQCGVMALDCFSANWGGGYKTYNSNGNTVFRTEDIIEFNNKNISQIPIISSSLTSNDIIGVSSNGIVAHNLFVVYENALFFKTNRVKENYGLDTIAGYNWVGTIKGVVPSPYLENGDRNPNYYCNDGREIYSGETIVSLTGNMLSDFNGYENTQIYLNHATGQTDWKTSSLKEGVKKDINDVYYYDSRGYYPAVCKTWKYLTPGTNQGDWYIPSIGELLYLYARYTEIKTSLFKCVNIYGGSSISINPYIFYQSTNSQRGLWSSSQKGENANDMLILENPYYNKSMDNTSSWVGTYTKECPYNSTSFYCSIYPWIRI